MSFAWVGFDCSHEHRVSITDYDFETSFLYINKKKSYNSIDTL